MEKSEFTGCSLTLQDHYDFGMRALKWEPCSEESKTIGFVGSAGCGICSAKNCRGSHQLEINADGDHD